MFQVSGKEVLILSLAIHTTESSIRKWTVNWSAVILATCTSDIRLCTKHACKPKAWQEQPTGMTKIYVVCCKRITWNSSFCICCLVRHSPFAKKNCPSTSKRVSRFWYGEFDLDFDSFWAGFVFALFTSCMIFWSSCNTAIHRFSMMLNRDWEGNWRKQKINHNTCNGLSAQKQKDSRQYSMKEDERSKTKVMREGGREGGKIENRHERKRSERKVRGTNNKRNWKQENDKETTTEFCP